MEQVEVGKLKVGKGEVGKIKSDGNYVENA